MATKEKENQKEGKVQISLSFPPGKIKEMKKAAIDEDLTTSELLEEAYEFYIEQKDKK